MKTLLSDSEVAHYLKKNCVFQGSKCEVQVKNGGVYEGVFKTYSPKVIFTIWSSLYGHAIS